MEDRVGSNITETLDLNTKNDSRPEPVVSPQPSISINNELLAAILSLRSDLKSEIIYQLNRQQKTVAYLIS